MTQLICRTCPRYDVPANGEFRRALDAQIAQNPAADPRTVRHVQCLGGCPDDGVAVDEGPGRLPATKMMAPAVHAHLIFTGHCRAGPAVPSTKEHDQ